jgi:hypothetical protein
LMAHFPNRTIRNSVASSTVPLSRPIQRKSPTLFQPARQFIYTTKGY